MKVYQVHSRPSESNADGETFDEWFTSLKAAKARRAEMIREAEAPDADPPKYLEDFEITQHEVRDLRLPELVVALLNRRGWQKLDAVALIVAPHTIKRRSP